MALLTHYLALDQAPKRIGFALGSPNMVAPVSGAYALPSAGARHGVMLHVAHEWLSNTIKVYHVTKVCFESPFLGKNVQSFALQNKLIGVIEEACEANNIPCVEVESDKWRMRFIGCCRAPRALPKSERRPWLKKQAIDACAARQWDVKNDDEAEACGILDWVLSCDFKDYGSVAGAPLLSAREA